MTNKTQSNVLYKSDSEIFKVKECSKCGDLKPLNQFYKKEKSPDGQDYWCKRCRKKYTADWRKTVLFVRNAKKRAKISTIEIVTSSRNINPKNEDIKITQINDDLFKIDGIMNPSGPTTRYRDYKQTLNLCKRMGVKFNPILA